jgi:hypothetical protein
MPVFPDMNPVDSGFFNLEVATEAHTSVITPGVPGGFAHVVEQ